MRIVAGELRGRVIQAPEGEGTRPTIDRVREALFSSLYSLRGGFEDAVVLDAFAGSGALGMESLSRGASQCVFYESGPQAAKVCQRNLESCGLAGTRAQLVRRDVLATPPVKQTPPFDLVFFDPPYAYDAARVLGMARSLVDAGALSGDAIVVYEHALADANVVTQAAQDAGFTVRSSKKYGKTGVTILR